MHLGAVVADAPSPLSTPRSARGNLSMSNIHHRPRKRDASETGVRRCIGFVLSKNLSPVCRFDHEGLCRLVQSGLGLRVCGAVEGDGLS